MVLVLITNHMLIAWTPLYIFISLLHIKPIWVYNNNNNNNSNTCIYKHKLTLNRQCIYINKYNYHCLMKTILCFIWFNQREPHIQVQSEKGHVHFRETGNIDKTKTNKTKTQHNMCWAPLYAIKHKYRKNLTIPKWVNQKARKYNEPKETPMSLTAIDIRGGSRISS